MSETTALSKGVGRMQVDIDLWRDFDKPLPLTPKEWQRVLLLPDTYTVESVDMDNTRGIFVLSVTHEAIPVVTGASYLPRVTPYYSVTTQPKRIVTLTRVEITQLKDGQWKIVAITDECV